MNVDLSEGEARAICELIATRFPGSAPDVYRRLYVKAQSVLRAWNRERASGRTPGQPSADEADLAERRQGQETVVDPPIAVEASEPAAVEAPASAPAAIRATIARLLRAEATAVLIGLTLRQGVRRAFWYSTVLPEEPGIDGKITDANWNLGLFEMAVHELATRIDQPR